VEGRRARARGRAGARAAPALGRQAHADDAGAGARPRPDHTARPGRPGQARGRAHAHRPGRPAGDRPRRCAARGLTRHDGGGVRHRLRRGAGPRRQPDGRVARRAGLRHRRRAALRARPLRAGHRRGRRADRPRASPRRPAARGPGRGRVDRRRRRVQPRRQPRGGGRRLGRAGRAGRAGRRGGQRHRLACDRGRPSGAAGVAGRRHVGRRARSARHPGADPRGPALPAQRRGLHAGRTRGHGVQAAGGRDQRRDHLRRRERSDLAPGRGRAARGRAARRARPAQRLGRAARRVPDLGRVHVQQPAARQLGRHLPHARLHGLPGLRGPAAAQGGDRLLRRRRRQGQDREARRSRDRVRGGDRLRRSRAQAAGAARQVEPDERQARRHPQGDPEGRRRDLGARSEGVDRAHRPDDAVDRDQAGDGGDRQAVLDLQRRRAGRDTGRVAAVDRRAAPPDRRGRRQGQAAHPVQRAQGHQPGAAQQRGGPSSPRSASGSPRTRRWRTTRSAATTRGRAKATSARRRRPSSAPAPTAGTGGGAASTPRSSTSSSCWRSRRCSAIG
jgi:hypothetical protein